MGSRRQGREIALQVLFQLESPGQEDPREALRLYFDSFSRQGESEVNADTRSFAEQLVYGVHESLGTIDDHLRSASQRWRVERMARVDRNVLRLATYELLQDRDTPTSVILDEAIEIAKRYGTDESASFVNAILDAIAQQVRHRE